jgi:hypothetical protein
MADNYANFDVAVLLDFGRLGSFAFWLVVIWREGEQQQQGKRWKNVDFSG